MSYYIIDDKYTFDNVLIGKKIKINDNLSKYNIYYIENEFDSPKEIFIKIPQTRLLYKLGNSKYKQENIALFPNYNKINNFVVFIKEFENNIKDAFISKLINIELNSLINKKENINYIKINFNDNFIITTNNNNFIKINDFKINNEIEIVIKLNHIWYKNNIIGLSSNLYQIKYYFSPLELNINLIDSNQINTTKIESSSKEISEIHNSKKYEISEKQSLKKSLDLLQTDNHISVKKPIRLIPSIEQLELAKLKLKQITK
jgi:hypothetical protein